VKRAPLSASPGDGKRGRGVLQEMQVDETHT
jgi:hypothetical protein